MDYVGHHIRSKLDELKRQELNRLREIAKKLYSESSSDPGHVDHQNPHSFEKNDLLKLIQQVCFLDIINFYNIVIKYLVILLLYLVRSSTILLK